MRTLVTGGNGHVGFNLAQTLLAEGHHVRASVRPGADPAKTAPLRGLGGIELVEADVADAAQMRAAVDGVDVLFHVAATYVIADAGRADEILQSSLRGAENALRAAADAGVRKVVLTSSVVTLPLTAPGAPPSTESDWNADLRIPYFRAKTEAERLAWRLAGELKLNLAAVLPAGVIGPGFQRNTPTIDLIEGAMRGMFRLAAPCGNFSYVDARDVARAHLMVAQQDAQGRFAIGYDEMPTFEALVRTMHAIDPRVKPALMEMPAVLAPTLPLADWLYHHLLGTPRIATPELIHSALGGHRWNFSSARARWVLGWEPSLPFEHSLRDTMQLVRQRLEGAGRRAVPAHA